MFRKLLLTLTLVIYSANAMQDEDVAQGVKQEVKDCTQVKVDETGFPMSLSYHEMDVLAGGGCLKTETGRKIMALEPQAMVALIPGTGKRIVRKALAFAGVAHDATANAFGDVKKVANRQIRTYQYIPALGKVGGQFSVYSEVRSPSPELKKPAEKEVELLEKLKRRDVVATTELQKGRMDPLVIGHFIEEQVGALKGLLAESLKALEKNDALLRDAVKRADMDAYAYLSLWIKKTYSQVIFLRQQIYFFEKKINAVRTELPQTEPHQWITLKGIFLNINFLHQEIDEEISAFLEEHQGFMAHHPDYPKASGIAKKAGYHNVEVAPAAAATAAATPAEAAKPASPPRPPRTNILSRESQQAQGEPSQAAQLKQSKDAK